MKWRRGWGIWMCRFRSAWLEEMYRWKDDTEWDDGLGARFDDYITA